MEGEGEGDRGRQGRREGEGGKEGGRRQLIGAHIPVPIVARGTMLLPCLTLLPWATREAET